MRAQRGRRPPDWWNPRGAALEYWFFRTAWAGGALLVDIIRRQAPATAEVRVSCLRSGTASVHRVHSGTSGTGSVEAAGCRIGRDATSGSVGSVTWELKLRPEPRMLLVPPQPFRATGATDLALASWPVATASGRVVIDGVQTMLRHESAMVCHYWGRRLPDEWLWISATDFDDPAISLEIGLIRSRLWGADLRLPRVGYAWLRVDGREQYVATPLSGVARQRGGGFGLPVRLRVRGVRTAFEVSVEAAPGSVADLGDRIRHSLAARCELHLPGGPVRCTDRAVLEFREPAGP